MTLKTLFNRSAATVAALAVAGGVAITAQAQSTALRGQVQIDGSSTVFPISEAAASDFRKDYPNVKVTVGVSGTGGGFKRFVKGETDISDASRPIKAKEFKAAKEAGVEFIELPVALDGLSIVINPSNDWASELTVEQLKTIFLSKSAPKTWNEVDPNWPAEPIKIYAPGTDSGTFDYFKEVVLGDGESFRSDMSTSEDDNVLVTGVSGERGAIGFFGASYYFNNKGKIKAAAIVNPKTGEAVLPTPEAVENGDYAPFSRPLFIYVNKKAIRRPEVMRFVSFYLENSADLAQRVDYVALPQNVRDRAMKFFKTHKTGTAYLTADLEKRSGGVVSVYTEDNLTSTK